LEAVLRRAPKLDGRPIRVRLAPDLRAHGGRLISGGSRGTEVHAGSFLRQREIVLGSELPGLPAEFARIFLHEVFHFVWLRAGNRLRRSWETLLEGELRRHARGELGWSADGRKRQLRPGDRAARSRRWRDYVCESFCDSAAWLLAGARAHEEFTLARRFREGRRVWLQTLLGRPELRV
jgi:hypothetical protein